ncbi:hypothetical protein QBC34DRAFT_443484 [Podospora aff. communis PSN243]|uniref:F-box domain-containing protein n=1 Tax=Podospora aff. communis PSN243 TaxID=3040156 RepID=A0AAV9G7F1_9PEZI|nr:hypothetical protein QBC34DRAFT_443484 [Podospora aff. communis PSN243]
MALASLPVELLRSIMAHFEPKELHPLRLTCRRLSIVASSHTMATLAFCLCKPDFDTLQRITSRPELAEHVTSLLYFAEMLSSKRYDLEAYAHAVRSWPFTDAELRDHFATYERLFEAQQEMLSQDTDFRVLEQLIPRLHNLEEITVTSRPGWSGTWEPDGETYDWYGWPLRDDWPLRRNMIEHTAIVSGCGVEQGDGPSRHLRALLRGALAPWDYNYEAYYAEGSGMMDRYTLAPHVTDGSICRTTMKQGVLRTALLSMPNLTTLRLIILGCIESYKLINGTCNPPSLEDMIAPEQVWPKLQFLTLEGMYAKQEQLAGIVLAAKTSLVKLELNMVRLLNGR